MNRILVLLILFAGMALQSSLRTQLQDDSYEPQPSTSQPDYDKNNAEENNGGLQQITNGPAGPAPQGEYLTHVVTPAFTHIQQLIDPNQPISNMYYFIRSGSQSSVTLKTDNNEVIQLDNNEILFAIETSRTAGWIGFGRSPDGGMVDSEVVVCEFSNGSPQLTSYLLQGQSYNDIRDYKAQVPIDDQHLITDKNQQGIQRRIMLFTRSMQDGQQTIELDAPQWYVYAFSDKDTLKEGMHNFSAGFMATISSSNAAGYQPTYAQQRILGHGALNFLSYIILFPMGILFARNRSLLS